MSKKPVQTRTIRKGALRFATQISPLLNLNLLNISMMLNKSIIQCSLVGVIISALQNDHKYIFLNMNLKLFLVGSV